MEIFSYHEGLKKWVEIGNSGMFRPEMLLPMGLPEGVSGMLIYHIVAISAIIIIFSYCVGFEFGETCNDQVWFG